jgi:hypothetical protein
VGISAHPHTGSHSERIENSLEDLECEARGSDGAKYKRSNIARVAIFENCTETELGDGTDSGDRHTNVLVVCCVCYDEVALCGWVLEAKIASNDFRSAMSNEESLWFCVLSATTDVCVLSSPRRRFPVPD